MKNEELAKNKIDIEKLNFDAIENLPNLILKGENYFNNQIAEICKKVCQNESIKIILLAGPSAAGKTTTSNLLALHFGMLSKRVVTVSLDNFFVDRDNTPRLADGSYDFECLNALDLKCLNEFIDDLLIRKVAHMPIYNFRTGMREKKKEKIVVDENTIIIFEGLHALNPKLITNGDYNFLKLYIALNSDFVLNDEVKLSARNVRLLRRITRDYYTRGYDVLNTIRMWDNVLDGENKYIKPFKQNADFIINSLHCYEPLLYANYSKKVIQQALNNSQEKTNEEIKLLKSLLDTLSLFEPIDKKLVPSTSLLWEFLNAAEWCFKSIFKIIFKKV